MSYIALFMAYKYGMHKSSVKGISSMLIISWFTIALSSCIITLICGIMRSFEKETERSLQGINAQATITAWQEPLDVNAMSIFFTRSLPEIVAWSPKTIRYGLLQKKSSTDTAPLMVTIIIIDPQREINVTCIGKHLLHNQSLTEAVKNNHIIIGHNAAKTLDVQEDDSLTVYVTENLSLPDTHFSYEKITTSVGGLIKTGIDEFDTHTIFCSYQMYETLFGPAPVEQIDIRLLHDQDEPAMVQKIAALTGLNVYSWKDLYPALIDALKLEKKVTFSVIILILCMALITIISLLYMYIQTKQTDIALLVSLGTPLATIKIIFLLIGTMLTACAAASGIVVAMLGSFYINVYQPFALPDAYYISHISVSLTPEMVGTLYIGIVLTGIIASLIPIQSVDTQTIAHTIRFER